MMKNEFRDFFSLPQHSEIIFTYFSSGILCREIYERSLELVSHFSSFFSPSFSFSTDRIIKNSREQLSHDIAHSTASSIACHSTEMKLERGYEVYDASVRLWRVWNLCLLFLRPSHAALSREAFLLPFERNVLVHIEEYLTIQSFTNILLPISTFTTAAPSKQS